MRPGRGGGFHNSRAHGPCVISCDGVSRAHLRRSIRVGSMWTTLVVGCGSVWTVANDTVGDTLFVEAACASRGDIGPASFGESAMAIRNASSTLLRSLRLGHPVRPSVGSWMVVIASGTASWTAMSSLLVCSFGSVSRVGHGQFRRCGFSPTPCATTFFASRHCLVSRGFLVSVLCAVRIHLAGSLCGRQFGRQCDL